MLERAFYDDIMAKRITDKMAPKATGALLKATAKFKQLARKARAEVARRPHVRRLPSSQDGQVIRDATREDKIAAGKALLGQRLAFLALRMVEMEDDGNCQFRALSHELYGSQDHHLRVRAGAVAYLRSHEADFAPFVGTAADWAHYLGRMAKSREWGDELTLQAACGAFAVDVRRHPPRRRAALPPRATRAPCRRRRRRAERSCPRLSPIHATSSCRISKPSHLSHEELVVIAAHEEPL